MVFKPVPAVDGVNTPVTGLTPGPENVPPKGVPPFSLKGLALIVVTVSKQVVNVTFGAIDPLMMIFAELTGFPVTQFRLDKRMHRTLSLFCGL